ncbi:hypothetical protein [Aquabacterium sp.]|uniref:hypothetical protein n=1 Tax=Aquabacterium sp. TaxID=1872578 RepID=UPI003BB1E718
MATKNTNQVKAVADKLVPQGKPLNSVAQGPVSKDAVTVADLAWLEEAQQSWESQRQLEEEANAAAQQGDLVVELVDSVHGESAVGDSLIDATYAVAEGERGAAVLLEGSGSGAAGGGAAATGGSAAAGGAAGGFFAGAGGIVAGVAGVGVAAVVLDSGGDSDGPAGPAGLKVISNDQSGGGVAISADEDLGIIAHYENIRVLTETDTGPYGDILVQSVNSHDVAVLNGEDTVIEFSEGFPSDITVVADGEQSDAVGIIAAAGPVGTVQVSANGVDSEALLYASLDGAVNGELALSAAGEDAYSAMYVEVSGGVNGNVTVSTTGDYANAYAELSLAGPIGGDITVTASGVEADAELLVNLNNSPSNYISDGGSDQYDGGNYISTEFQGNIYYTPEVLSDDAFGAGSQHVFAYQDSVFALMVTGNQSDTFSVTGNTGQDGSGASEDVTILGEYGGFTAIAYRSSNEEPSMNRLFMYEGASSDVTINPVNGVADNEDFYLSGLADIRNFSYVALFSASTDAIGDEELTAFFQTYVDDVLKAGGSGVASVTDALSSFYDADVQTALRAELPPLYENFEFALPAASLAELSGSSITVTADGQYAYAYAYVDAVTGTAGAINVEAAGEGSWAEGHLNISGNVSGDIHVLTSADAAGESYDASYAHAGFYAQVSDGITGDITVQAQGVGSEANLSVWAGGDITGNVTVEATGGTHEFSIDGYDRYYAANARARVLAEGDLTGNLSLTASGESSDAYLYAYTGGALDGDVMVTASGVEADAMARLNRYASTSAPVAELAGTAFTVEASGTYAYAYAYVGDDGIDAESARIFSVTGVAGAISVTASGESSEADMFLTLDGSVSGDITVLASGADASAQFGEDYFFAGPVEITGDINGDITVSATGGADYASATMLVGGDVTGDISLNADNGGNVALRLSAQSVQDIQISTGAVGAFEGVDAYIDVPQYYGESLDVASHVGDVVVTGGEATYVDLSFGDRFSNSITLGADGDDFDGNFSLSLGVSGDVVDASAGDWIAALDGTLTPEDTAFLNDHMITIDGFAQGLGNDTITFNNLSIASYSDGGSFDTFDAFLTGADAALDTVDFFFAAVDTDGDEAVDTSFLAVSDGDGNGGISYLIRFDGLTEFESSYVTNAMIP